MRWQGCCWFLLIAATINRLDAAEESVGTIILHGGGTVDPVIRNKFLELAGGEAAQIVVIPTADPDTPLDESRLEPWRNRKLLSVQLLHAESREESEPEAFAEPLRHATGVWMTGGWQTRLASRYLKTPVERELTELLKRGGVIFGTSAGAAVLSQVMIVRGETREGFDLVRNAVIDQHFLVRNREERLWNVLARHPDRFGLGIDEDTAAVIQGPRLTVLGESTVTVCAPLSSGEARRQSRLQAGDLFDLGQLQIPRSPRLGAAD